MGNETLIIFSLGIILGGIICYILLSKFKLKNRIETINQRKIINNPVKLKELLEKNGTYITDGKRIVFKIEKDAEGKDILKQGLVDLTKEELKIYEELNKGDIDNQEKVIHKQQEIIKPIKKTKPKKPTKTKKKKK